VIEVNNIYLGDCLEVMKEIKDQSIDMVLCDLPYGSIMCKWDIIIPLNKLWECYNKITKENTAIVLFGCQPFTSLLGASNIEDLKYSWVWEKTKPTNFLNSKKVPLRGFEDVLVFYKKQPIYNPQGLLIVNRKVKNTGTKNRTGATKANGDQSFHGHIADPTNQNNDYHQKFTNFPRGIILQAQNGSFKSLHPTEKPVALLEYLIKTYTNENDLVLDNTCGSGSTLVAAQNLNRRFIGIEKEEKYFNIAKERLKF